MISSQTRSAIKGYLEGFIDGLIEQHRSGARTKALLEYHNTNRSSEGSLKPFHEAIIPQEILRISAFERSFSTKLGTTFEECAKLIALQRFPIVKRGYIASGQMPAKAASKIEEIVSRINSGYHPDFPTLISEVLDVRDSEWVKRPVIADLYLEDNLGRRYFFELKSPKPNKGQCLEIAERLLRIHAITQENRPKVNAYFAMAYNPYGPNFEDYRHNISLQYLDMEHEVLIGQAFWEFIGDQQTYEALLEIYNEVGREKYKVMMDALMFNF